MIMKIIKIIKRVLREKKFLWESSSLRLSHSALGSILGFWMILLDSSKPVIVEEDAYDHQLQRLDLRFLGNLTLASNLC